MTQIHSFHIPVMGTAFTIDSPIRVAHYGISSVISLVDDTLVEQMRAHYCRVFGEEYREITKYDDDFRARRITEYLNLVDRIVKQKFEEVRSSCFEIGSEISKYFEMLPPHSPLKRLYNEMKAEKDKNERKKIQEQLRAMMKPGDINVNIMTKLDRDNFDAKKKKLPPEFSDALAALRGYAQSSLDSAIIFSAGINRRLYTYAEQFEDFYANAVGDIKKRIVLKVSDYRSSLIQGRFFAKKGLWVSEYRIESGLNCGGHAFASDGFLMGPILEEFKNKRNELKDSLYKVYISALEAKNKILPPSAHDIAITAQGGIGTGEEDQFLRTHYNIDGTGWGTPFLLVPEATNVDVSTLDKLSQAKEDDLYLSKVSPLGVPFNNLRDSLSDLARDERIHKDRPGSACPKGHLVSNTEFTEVPICTASRQYQKLKLDQLDGLDLPKEKYEQEKAKVLVKSCICHDLGEAALIKNEVEIKGRAVSKFPAVCPGPNLAYFSHVVSLQAMVDHIYGEGDVGVRLDRPNLFVKELDLYVKYFEDEVKKYGDTPTDKQITYLKEFASNMRDGIVYYEDLFPTMFSGDSQRCQIALDQLTRSKNEFEEFVSQFVFFQQKIMKN